MLNEFYKYKGIPLTPNISEELLLSYYSGKLTKRGQIVTDIIDIHLKKGGKEPEATDKDRMIKRALENLKDKGLAENKSRGYWIVISKQEPLNSISETPTITHDESINILPINDDFKSHVVIDEAETTNTDSRITLGKGNESVYVYYLPIYKEQAEKEKKTSWACKIGRTDRDPFQRIISQSSTSLPESPVIALIIKTHNSRALETIIHNILSYRNKKIVSALGREWFDTNPDEILKIVQFSEQSSMFYN